MSPAPPVTGHAQAPTSERLTRRTPGPRPPRTGQGNGTADVICRAGPPARTHALVP